MLWWRFLDTNTQLWLNRRKTLLSRRVLRAASVGDCRSSSVAVLRLWLYRLVSAAVLGVVVFVFVFVGLLVACWAEEG